jgi:hypothetical protein
LPTRATRVDDRFRIQLPGLARHICVGRKHFTLLRADMDKFSRMTGPAGL